MNADEGTGDHPAHAELQAGDLVGHLADPIELVERDHLLVGRHLEHAVLGGVDDRPPGADVLLPQLLEDLGAGGGLVAEHPAPDALLEGLDDLGREAARVGPEGLLGHEPGHLPVSGRGVLAGAALGHLAEGPFGLRVPSAVEGRRQIAQTERAQVRDLHVARSEDVPEGVAPFVAEGSRVGRRTHAQTIADDDDGAPEGPHQDRSERHRVATASASAASAHQATCSWWRNQVICRLAYRMVSLTISRRASSTPSAPRTMAAACR